MLLSPDQVKRFWREWPKACRYQGWTRDKGFNAEQVDAKRKELLKRCGFDSLTKVNRTSGFDKVLAELRALQDNLVGAMEAEDATIGEARRLRNVISNEILPCLRLYVDDVQAYVTTVMEDKNRWWKIDRPARDITLDDLDARPVVRHVRGQLREFPSSLQQLMMTLSGRLNAKRKASGDTIHQMKIAAGVPCYCAECSRVKVRLEQTDAVEHLPEEIPSEKIPF